MKLELFFALSLLKLKVRLWLLLVVAFLNNMDILLLSLGFLNVSLNLNCFFIFAFFKIACVSYYWILSFLKTFPCSIWTMFLGTKIVNSCTLKKLKFLQIPPIFLNFFLLFLTSLSINIPCYKLFTILMLISALWFPLNLLSFFLILKLLLSRFFLPRCLSLETALTFPSIFLTL